jgi:hypothetical protein
MRVYGKPIKVMVHDSNRKQVIINHSVAEVNTLNASTLQDAPLGRLVFPF